MGATTANVTSGMNDRHSAIANGAQEAQ